MRSAILNLSLLINPILSVLTAIYLKIDLKKHYVFIAICCGYIAMLLEPSIDLMGNKSPDVLRHYERFNEYDLGISFFEQVRKDLFITFEYYLFNLLGIKKEIIPFISVFVSYYCVFKIFNLLFKGSELKNINLLFLAVFLVISFRGSAFGIRNYPAIYLIMYGLFLYFHEKNKLKGIFFILLANSMHIMTALITVLFLVFLMTKKILKLNFLSLLFYCSLVILFVPGIASSIVKIFESFLPINISAYTEGQWAGEYLEGKNLRGLIFYYFPMYLKLVFMTFTAIYLKNRIKLINFFKFYIIFFITLCFMHDFKVIFERYIAFGFIFSIVLWLIYFKEQNKIYTIFVRLIFVVALLVFSFDFYVIRFILPKTLSKLIYPTIYNLVFDSIPYEDYLFIER